MTLIAPALVGQSASRTAAAAAISFGLLFPVTAAPVTSQSRSFLRLVASDWTSPSSDRAAASEPVDSVEPRSLVEAFEFVRRTSGLTMEQLSRLFGVSRRSVHAWAGGAKLSSANEELLVRLEAALEERSGFPSDENRLWLLISDGSHPSVFDQLRRSRVAPAIVTDAGSALEQLGLER